MLKKFTDLVGWTLEAVENRDGEELIFTLDGGDQYALYHDQDCCESVTIEDVNGNLEDLIGSPILMAEEAVHDRANPLGLPNKNEEEFSSFTWTFYKIGTIKGFVTIRWYGGSNGYYGEYVEWERRGKP